MVGKADVRPAVGSAEGDADRQELVRAHLPLVRAMARRYARRSEEFDDLVQAGSVGLVKAAGRFDPTRGVAFATFVAPSVEGEIRRHLRARKGDGRIAVDTTSLETDEPVGDQTVDGESLTTSEYRVLLADGLRVLDEREQRIVFLRFHADMTERQIAETMGISQAHVSRLLDGALTKLRAELADPNTAGDSAQIEAISPSNIASVGAEEKGQDDKAAGETAPAGRRAAKPKAATGYSGRILVRMPSELHEQLAAAAERDEISLNRYVNDALSSSVEAGGDGAPAADDQATNPSRLSPRGLRVALATNVAVVVVAGVVAVVLLVLALQRGI